MDITIKTTDEKLKKEELWKTTRGQNDEKGKKLEKKKQLWTKIWRPEECGKCGPSGREGKKRGRYQEKKGKAYFGRKKCRYLIMKGYETSVQERGGGGEGRPGRERNGMGEAWQGAVWEG